MMLRGEFTRGDGLVIPNNITEFGAQLILQLAFQKSSTDLWMGLADVTPQNQLTVEQCGEPVLGTGGYKRQQLAPTPVDWPVAGSVNGEAYVESMALEFPVTDVAYSKQIRRMFLTASLDSLTAQVFAVSGALAEPVIIGPTTPEAQRTFKYRIYLR